MLVIYVNYGEGMTFKTGPVALRVRVGLWGHFYRRVHPRGCNCARCLERVCAGPVETLPQGRETGRMYKVAR